MILSQPHWLTCPDKGKTPVSLRYRTVLMPVGLYCTDPSAESTWATGAPVLVSLVNAQGRAMHTKVEA